MNSKVKLDYFSLVNPYIRNPTISIPCEAGVYTYHPYHLDPTDGVISNNTMTYSKPSSQAILYTPLPFFYTEDNIPNITLPKRLIDIKLKKAVNIIEKFRMKKIIPQREKTSRIITFIRDRLYYNWYKSHKKATHIIEKCYSHRIFKRHINNFRATCPICYDNMWSKENILTKCNHMFHFSCLNNWLANHDECPICRQATQT